MSKINPISVKGVTNDYTGTGMISEDYGSIFTVGENGKGIDKVVDNVELSKNEQNKIKVVQTRGESQEYDGYTLEYGNKIEFYNSNNDFNGSMVKIGKNEHHYYDSNNKIIYKKKGNAIYTPDEHKVYEYEYVREKGLYKIILFNEDGTALAEGWAYPDVGPTSVHEQLEPSFYLNSPTGIIEGIVYDEKSYWARDFILNDKKD